jgi:hypothetical protein
MWHFEDFSSSLLEPQKSTTLNQVLEWESVSPYNPRRSLAKTGAPLGKQKIIGPWNPG